jgi:hypothetical protein
MKNIKWYIIAAVIIALGIWIVVLNIRLSEKNHKIYYQDSIHHIDSTKWMVLTELYKSIKQAHSDLKRENAALLDTIENRNEEIRMFTNFVIGFKKKIYIRVDTTTKFEVRNDTIYVPIGDDTVYIKENFIDLIEVEGYTVLNPYKKSELEFSQPKPLEFDIVITEDENGVYNTYLDLKNPNLSVLKFKSRLILQERAEKFWDRIGGMTGMFFTNEFGFVTAGISYRHIGIGGLYGKYYDDLKSNIIGAGVFINF